ncbi:MAG: M24 family metallopeptidase [Acidobacteriota bacterium]|nr:M24 family metallopeptidase [Acidobacteriota bacterium]
MPSQPALRRRDLLRAIPVIFGASAAGSLAFGAEPETDATLTSLDLEQSGRVEGLPTAFSLAERDRRWARVRAMMRRSGFDCLLTPAASGDADADSRYLTGRRGWVIFPGSGPVTLVHDGDDDAAVPWVSDVRVAEDGHWSLPVIDALRALKIRTARLGVGRLDGVLRNIEGDVTATTLDRIRAAFPRARVVSAADPLMRVKLVRSDEEIAALEHATAAGERAIAAMIEIARPGAQHKDVWLRIFAEITGATGETPQRLAIRAGNEANTSTGGPMLETLRAGQICNQEIGARVLGYMAQVNHSICIGSEAPPNWQSAGQYCVDVFHELVEWIKPGKSFLDLCRFYVGRAKAHDPSFSPTGVLIHTCGFGDGPRMGLTRSETPDLVIEPGMVFTVKPRIVIAGTRPTAQFGDPVLVTDRGARRLGKRNLSLVSTG